MQQRPSFPILERTVERGTNMKRKVWKIQMPLLWVKGICMAAVLMGILFLVSGIWVSGLCMLLGAYILEKSQYCCPKCGKRLDMKHPLRKDACCPFCREPLRRAGEKRMEKLTGT